MDVTATCTHCRIGTRRGFRALAGLTLAALLGLAAEVRPAAAADAVVGNILPAFNQICSELQTGRQALQRGRLRDEAFVDLVLDLFVRADSLSVLLKERSPATHGYTPATALARGLRCLKDSLRENYEGMVARDGGRFVTADLELTAAIAWRSGITNVASAAP
jgi:hypothetical protein